MTIPASNCGFAINVDRADDFTSPRRSKMTTSRR